jgi:hypothetical protein
MVVLSTLLSHPLVSWTDEARGRVAGNTMHKGGAFGQHGKWRASQVQRLAGTRLALPAKLKRPGADVPSTRSPQRRGVIGVLRVRATNARKMRVAHAHCLPRFFLHRRRRTVVSVQLMTRARACRAFRPGEWKMCGSRVLVDGMCVGKTRQSLRSPHGKVRFSILHLSATCKLLRSLTRGSRS